MQRGNFTFRFGSYSISSKDNKNYCESCINDNFNPYELATFLLSDGINYVTVKMLKEVLDEIWIYDNQISLYSIVAIKGDVLRQISDDGNSINLILG